MKQQVALDMQLVDRALPPVRRSWNADDVMLYAVAVGAGEENPTEELPFTTENTSGVQLRVLPTFANMITRGTTPSLGDFDSASLLHAQQRFVVHSEIPVAGCALVSTRVAAIEDVGTAALVTVESTAIDESSGQLLATTAQQLYIRGEGGFGGVRPSRTKWEAGSGGPDVVVDHSTRSGQALLYRLTGDRNPLHSDPEVAQRASFERPILHGMCTFGFAGRALLHTLCGSDPARFRSMSARFTAPVSPGAELQTRIWIESETCALFQVQSDDRIVLDRGRLEYEPSPDSTQNTLEVSS